MLFVSSAIIDFQKTINKKGISLGTECVGPDS